MQDLGTLGGSFSGANGINDLGQVVGGSGITGDMTAEHAFFYSAGHMLDLGTLGGSISYATGINNLGQVVGSSSLITGFKPPVYAFLYSDGKMANLNSLLCPNSGWTLSAAVSINDAGQIVGDGTLNGQAHAFLLTPVR
jgi:probable HAF family extracellular repeat protein